jgi:hypothetical protein
MVTFSQLDAFSLPGAAKAWRTVRSARKLVNTRTARHEHVTLANAHPVTTQLKWDLAKYYAAAVEPGAWLQASYLDVQSMARPDLGGPQAWFIDIDQHVSLFTVHGNPSRDVTTSNASRYAGGIFDYEDATAPGWQRVATVTVEGDKTLSDNVDRSTWYSARLLWTGGATLSLAPALSLPRNLKVNGRPARNRLDAAPKSVVVTWDPPANGTPSEYLVLNGMHAYHTTGTRLEVLNPRSNVNGVPMLQVTAQICRRAGANPCAYVESVGERYDYNDPEPNP